MNRVFRAIEIAIRAHDTAPRKHTKVPYVIHPVRVLQRVNTYLDASYKEYPGASRFVHMRENMLVVCALHDVLEDTKYPVKELENEFGSQVMEGLQWLTNVSKNYKHKSRAEQKAMDRQRLSDAPDVWKVVKMFDRIDNLYESLAAPRDFIINTYIPESRLLIEAIGNADAKVAEQAETAIQWLLAVTPS